MGAQFATKVPRARKSLWAHPMVILGNVCQVDACFCPFGDSVSLDGRKVHVCAERIIGLEIILDAPDGPPR
jgi:hypothetical protein